MSPTVGWVVNDAEVVLRSFAADDEAALLAGRDGEWARWLGPGHAHPRPTACILVDDEVDHFTQAAFGLVGSVIHGAMRFLLWLFIRKTLIRSMISSTLPEQSGSLNGEGLLLRLVQRERDQGKLSGPQNY